MTHLFGHAIRSEVVGLFLLESLLCFAAAYLVLAGGAGGASPAEQSALLLTAALLAISSGLAAGVTGLYHPDTWLQAGRLLAGAIIVSLLLLLIGAWIAPLLLPQSAGSAWTKLRDLLPVLVAAVLATRLGLLLARRCGLLRRRILAFPAGDAGDPGLSLRGDASFEVVTALPPGALPSGPALREWMRANRPWAVVTNHPADLPAELTDEASRLGVRLLRAAEFEERRLGRVDLDALPPDWLATLRGGRENLAAAAVRRGLDILASALLLLLTLPLLLVAAAAIKLDSPGPVLYRQERVGLGGRRFMVLKLRSMRTDAEAAGTAKWAVRGDSRVTRVGRIIRLFRIDEIPQVLNVLRGDMAFVGPRPERPSFVQELEALIPHYADRAIVKPGITGWAQVNYPYGASVEDARQKLTYDLYYVKQRSLFLDLLIVIATVRVVLFQEGSR